MSTTDRRQLGNSLDVLLRAALQGWQAGMWTAMPAIVSSFNSSKMTVECLPTIQLQRNIAGVITWIDFPALVDCPVVFPSAGGFSLTFPIKAGDEVLVVFASRCIDSWWSSGKNGIQNELRMHDASDGFVIPGPRSVPKVIGDINPDNVELRADDGSALISIAPDGEILLDTAGKVTVNAAEATVTAADITLNGEVTINGDLQVNGAQTNTGIITAVDLMTVLLTLGVNVHQHVKGGGGSTDGPKNP